MADDSNSLFKNTFSRFTAEAPKAVQEEEDPFDAYMKQIESQAVA